MKMNTEHVVLVKNGAAAIAAWREAHPEANLDLSWANLTGANLTEAIFPDGRSLAEHLAR